MIRKGIFRKLWSVPVLAMLFALPLGAKAETQGSGEMARHPQVAEHLKDFQRNAQTANREADLLNSFLRNRHLQWQSHVQYLDQIKDRVNQMGKTLVQMEALKAVAGPSQRAAIENARPHLEVIAANMTRAYDLMNEGRANIHQQDYASAVREVYQHSSTLAEKLDTILDYERAKVRLNSLELQPAFAE
jgi:hypothetical protein